jgi:S1-C subfamily serine protease
VTKDGYVLTNNHVIEHCKGNIYGAVSGEPELKLRHVAADESNDLAVLVAPARFDDIARFRDASIRPGESVVVVGFPYYGIVSTGITVTTGIISSLGGIRDDSRFLQISAPVQPGNSGGPLFDTSGNVVGAITARLDALAMLKHTGTLPENVNFAIKSSLARDFLDRNAVLYEQASSIKADSAADITHRARLFTVRIRCTAQVRE